MQTPRRAKLKVKLGAISSVGQCWLLSHCVNIAIHNWVFETSMLQKITLCLFTYQTLTQIACVRDVRMKAN